MIFSVPPSQACALPMRPPRRRYSSVSRQNQIFSACAPRARARRPRPGRRPSARRAHARQQQQAGPAAAAFAVDHLDALAEAALAEQPVGLARGLEGPRDAAGEVDRDDVAAGLEQRLPDGEEVADRRLRGGREFGVGAQPLVEGVEAVHLQLALGLALPADVQADLMDASRVGERSRQVMGAVGCDRDGAMRARDATPTPARALPTRTSR